jgi:predicted enzyme related to lactoylglutathione lyase
LAAVTHFSRISKIVIDVPAPDVEREVAFWQTATGSELPGYTRFPEYHGGPVPGQDAIGLLIQRLSDGPARVHIDIHTDDLDAEVARLEQAGATRAGEVNGWWILQDPAGLPFCVIPDPPGTLHDGNAQRWD